MITNPDGKTILPPWTNPAQPGLDNNVGAIHNTGVNPSRMTVPAGAAGLWLVIGLATWAGGAGAQRQTLLLKNGAGIITNVVTASAVYNPQNVFAALLVLNVGDYLELQGYQDSGGNLTVVATFAAVRLAA